MALSTPPVVGGLYLTRIGQTYSQQVYARCIEAIPAGPSGLLASTVSAYRFQLVVFQNNATSIGGGYPDFVTKADGYVFNAATPSDFDLVSLVP